MSDTFEAITEANRPVWFRYNHERRSVEWAYDIRVWSTLGRHDKLREFFAPSCLRAIADALEAR